MSEFIDLNVGCVSASVTHRNHQIWFCGVISCPVASVASAGAGLKNSSLAETGFLSISIVSKSKINR